MSKFNEIKSYAILFENNPEPYVFQTTEHIMSMFIQGWLKKDYVSTMIHFPFGTHDRCSVTFIKTSCVLSISPVGTHSMEELEKMSSRLLRRN